MSDYFFTLNKEHHIGFKQLTKTDLGLDSNNVTHIGLLTNMLLFLPNDDVVKSGLLIYENYCEILNFYFDRILRESGKYNSPKIRSGKDSKNSIVVKIREIVNTDPNSNWYLVWVGLDSEEVVFWLIKEGTEDYQIAQKFFSKDKEILDEQSPSYNNAADYLLKRINFDSIDVQKDIEVKSQIGDLKLVYKRKDIEKADALFRETGKSGEELIAQYLEIEKKNGRIQSFLWENKSRESGLPYDFIIDDEQFVDVKSTRFDFDQYIYFSNAEIDFVVGKDDLSYSVFRVFDMDKTDKKLRICKSCNQYMNRINKPIIDIQQEMIAHNTLLETLKIGVKPIDCFINIQNPITL